MYKWVSRPSIQRCSEQKCNKISQSSWKHLDKMGKNLAELFYIINLKNDYSSYFQAEQVEQQL